ncbi:MAG: hypothetical protein ACLVL6_14000 [Clostridium paraputrificum]
MISEEMFFDTDCISSFLWVKRGDIIINLFNGKIILPKPVYDELKNPHIPHIGREVDNMYGNNLLEVVDIEVGSEEYNIYHELAIAPPKERIPIGKGEAAAIALAKVNGGVVASNNLRDIMYYVKKYDLKYVTTGDILARALYNGEITEDEGNCIWRKMLSKKRKLPTTTFTEFINQYVQAIEK